MMSSRRFVGVIYGRIQLGRVVYVRMCRDRNVHRLIRPRGNDVFIHLQLN